MTNQLVRGGFFFLADHPALDFLNTKPLVRDQPQELLTDFAAVLRWFVAARLLEKSSAERLKAAWGGSQRANASLASILDFRESLRSTVLAIESTRRIPQSAIEEVNELLKQHPFSFNVVGTGSKLKKKITFASATPEDLIGILANTVADLFSETDLQQIRKCETCVIHFRDTTKNHTRRWCSMQFCGNRAKVAAYTARNRQPSPKRASKR
jgi:predicted RNA-binding Zn ribbon-like protein